jgi:hypothetical protein
MTRLSRRALYSALALGVGLALAACSAPAPPAVEEEEAPAAAEGPEVSFTQEPNVLHIQIDGKPFANYHYSDTKTTRPFFANVKTPSGVQVTRNHPLDPEKDLTDHETMHLGIWMSFGDISGNDYWRLKAKTKHERFVEAPKGGPGKGSFTVRNYYWNVEDTDRIAEEVATYTIEVVDDGYLLLWDTRFSPYGETEEIVFGDQEEFGLGIRTQTKIAEQFGGQITDSEGRKGADEIWSKSADWIDYAGELEGQWIGMTIMPDPENFRPSWYHARDYGLIVANAFGREAMQAGDKSEVPVKKGETLRLRYGVLIHSADAPEDIDLNAAYQKFLERIGGE